MDEEIKVTDHRRFSGDGEVREDVVKDLPKGSADKGKKEEHAPLPEIDFPTFILSLATSAQVHLGAIPNPATGKKEQDFSLAKQTIDIIAMLEGKAKGNLTNDESRLIEHVLYDLRMMYVEVKSRSMVR